MSQVNRRDFIRVTGVSTAAAGAVLFSGCSAPEKEMIIQAPNRLPEDTVSSFENWYASVCGQCAAGCGILTRVVEGRVKKIEGNPDHPVNRGKLCPRGLAGPQDLYHPDRIRTPLRRTGPRGSGQYQVITWDDAIEELTARLKDQADQGQADRVTLITEPHTGISATILQRFTQAYGSGIGAFETMEKTVLRAAMRRVFGQDRMPTFDIAGSSYILSFGANFLEPWVSQVQYNRHYGEFRQGRPGQRGYLVQIEPRLSMTAANADEWVPINPGTEGVLALSIAQVIVAENLGGGAAGALTGGAGAQALTTFRPDEASRITGVPAEKIQELARNFARQRPSLALGGSAPASHTNGLFNLTAIYALNHLVENVGRAGGVQFNAPPAVEEFASVLPATSFQDWRRFAERLRTGQPRPVSILLVHGANPLYGLPAEVDFGGGLRNVPQIISFSTVLNETSALADLILPDHSYLESWGSTIPDPGAGYETIGLQQPAVEPLYSTMPFTDVILQVAARLGGALQQQLPWQTTRDALRASMQKVFEQNRGSVRAPDFERFWVGVLQRGGWWDFQAARPAATQAAPVLARQGLMPEFAGSESDYPYHLMISLHSGIGDGRMAHLPWLQMTPDATTTVAWQSWIEINPETAKRLGVHTEDIVTVESPSGRLEAIVYEYPAIPPNVVSMPAGQGHTSMGRYAQRRGVNPFSILAPMQDIETGALAWGATRVRINGTGRRYSIPRLEGGVSARQPDDYQVVQITDLRGTH